MARRCGAGPALFHPIAVDSRRGEARKLACKSKVREANRVKQPRLFALGVALLAALATSSASARPGWLTDYKQAREEAKASKKLVLLNFTGSDWCGWCIRLEREVFSKPEFQEFAKNNLILVEVDFPRTRQLSAAEKSQNAELAQKYQIQGFPTIIVLDSEGRLVGELGYTPGGPAAFIAKLEKLPKT
jgi:protein disulfide-isomerase